MNPDLLDESFCDGWVDPDLGRCFLVLEDYMPSRTRLFRKFHTDFYEDLRIAFLISGSATGIDHLIDELGLAIADRQRSYDYLHSVLEQVNHKIGETLFVEGGNGALQRKEVKRKTERDRLVRLGLSRGWTDFSDRLTSAFLVNRHDISLLTDGIFFFFFPVLDGSERKRYVLLSGGKEDLSQFLCYPPLVVRTLINGDGSPSVVAPDAPELEEIWGRLGVPHFFGFPPRYDFSKGLDPRPVVVQSILDYANQQGWGYLPDCEGFLFSARRLEKQIKKDRVRLTPSRFAKLTYDTVKARMEESGKPVRRRGPDLQPRKRRSRYQVLNHLDAEGKIENFLPTPVPIQESRKFMVIVDGVSPPYDPDTDTGGLSSVDPSKVKILGGSS